jgi:hypothetical protein
MYVKIKNGSIDTYPYSIGQLRNENSNTSFPKEISTEMLEAYDVFEVTILDAPSITNRTQKVEQEDTPTLVSGVWTLAWKTSDKTSEEVAEYDAEIATVNRIKRHGLLGETDYLALSDNTLTSEMKTYRQALRDLPTHSNWPNLEDADWPTKP